MKMNKFSGMQTVHGRDGKGSPPRVSPALFGWSLALATVLIATVFDWAVLQGPEHPIHVVTVHPVTSEYEQEQRFIVPREAVSSNASMDILFVVKEGRAVQRGVKLGALTGAGQIVLSGLSDGEKVAVSGLEDLREGNRVRIEQ